MRKVVVSEYVTLDGVMEDPGCAEGFEHGGWSFQFWTDIRATALWSAYKVSL